MHISYTAHMTSSSTSCFGTIDYLDKENQTKEKDIGFDGFFSGDYSETNTDESIPIDEIVRNIDDNRGSRSLKQSNFYMINVSPKRSELQHMERLAGEELKKRGLEKGKDGFSRLIYKEQMDQLMKMQMKLYVKDLMGEYAANFDREIYVDESLLPSKKERKVLEEETDVLFREYLKVKGIALKEDKIDRSKEYITIEKEAITGEDGKHYLLEVEIEKGKKEQLNMPKKVLFKQKDGSYKLPVNFYEKKLEELSKGKDKRVDYVSINKENIELKTPKKKAPYYLLEQREDQLENPLKLYFKKEEIIEEQGRYKIDKSIFDKQHFAAYNKSVTDQYKPQRDDIYQKLAKDKGYNLHKRKLTSDDLLWYGKIEKNRTHKPTDRYVINNNKTLKEIEKLSADKLRNAETIKALERRLIRDEKNNIIKAGMRKEGLQYHAHVVVSRHDKTMQNPDNKISLSPLANHKRGKMHQGAKVGFDRDRFNQKAETGLPSFCRTLF